MHGWRRIVGGSHTTTFLGAPFPNTGILGVSFLSIVLARLWSVLGPCSRPRSEILWPGLYCVLFSIAGRSSRLPSECRTLVYLGNHGGDFLDNPFCNRRPHASFNQHLGVCKEVQSHLFVPSLDRYPCAVDVFQGFFERGHALIRQILKPSSARAVKNLNSGWRLAKAQAAVLAETIARNFTKKESPIFISGNGYFLFPVLLGILIRSSILISAISPYPLVLLYIGTEYMRCGHMCQCPVCISADREYVKLQFCSVLCNIARMREGLTVAYQGRVLDLRKLIYAVYCRHCPANPGFETWQSSQQPPCLRDSSCLAHPATLPRTGHSAAGRYHQSDIAHKSQSS